MIFIILTIINFMVITKGSERVAEVAARFTLDAMPGKQMSIDADLNAGLINEEQARARRREIEREADFYGAMDRASKFVKVTPLPGLSLRSLTYSADWPSVSSKRTGFGERSPKLRALNGWRRSGFTGA